MFPDFSTPPSPSPPPCTLSSDRVGINKVRGDAVGTDRSDDHHRGCVAMVHRGCRPHLVVLLHGAGKWGPPRLGLRAGFVEASYGRHGLYFGAPKNALFERTPVRLTVPPSAE